MEKMMMQMNRSWAVFSFPIMSWSAPTLVTRSPVSLEVDTSPEKAVMAAPAMAKMVTNTHRN